MKHILALFVCLCCFSLSACSQASTDTTKVDSTLQKQLDNMKEDISTRIDSLNSEISNIKQAKEDNSNLVIIALALGIIGLISSIISFIFIAKIYNHIDKLNKRIDRRVSKDEINDAFKQVDKKYAKVADHGNKFAPKSTPSDYEELKREIKNINEKIDKLSTNNKNEKIEISTKPNIEDIKTAYLGAPTGSDDKMYFIDEILSQNDKACFVIYKKNNNNAEFDLLDIQIVKSMDNFDKVARTSGCNLSEAKNFTTLKRGKLEKIDDCWKVKEPLNIKLTK